MERDLVKRFIKKDGSQRIFFYRDEYAENPRDLTDEPLHCEDWSREFSIMNKEEKSSKSDCATSLIRYLLERYASYELFDLLKANSRHAVKYDGENSLVYDNNRKEWVLMYWDAPWKDYEGVEHGNRWKEETCMEVLSAADIVPYLSDEQVDILADKKYFTDDVKIASYRFGYYGEILFDDSFSADSEGICWLEKDEFLKYSGCEEDYWKGKTLREIEFLVGELEAWCVNDVYGFVVEDCVKSKIHKVYVNVIRDEEEYEKTEWEESASCWGFYGDLNKI